VVHRGSRKLDLSPKEFELLEFLLRHSGEVLTRAMIAERVWDCTWDRMTNVIDVHVTRLRRKLEDGDALRLIYSVRGIGYIMKAPDE
jgi:DNA-binding response OmpR family regulator